MSHTPPSKTAGLLNGQAKRQAQAIFEALTSRNSRRCYPTEEDSNAIRAIIEQAIHDKKPIPMLKYWAKGPCDARPAEMRAMEFLAGSLAKAAEIYAPGFDITIAFDDVRAKFNGVDFPEDHKQHTASMFQRAFAEFENIHIRTTKVSDHMPYTPTDDHKSFKDFERIEEMAYSVKAPPEIQAMFEERVRTHYFRTNHTPEEVTQMYCKLCEEEKPVIGSAFPGHIFLTYNSNEMGYLQPKGLPAIHYFSVCKGETEKPWYCDKDAFARIDSRHHSKKSQPEELRTR